MDSHAALDQPHHSSLQLHKGNSLRHQVSYNHQPTRQHEQHLDFFPTEQDMHQQHCAHYLPARLLAHPHPAHCQLQLYQRHQQQHMEHAAMVVPPLHLTTTTPSASSPCTPRVAPSPTLVVSRAADPGAGPMFPRHTRRAGGNHCLYVPCITFGTDERCLISMQLMCSGDIEPNPGPPRPEAGRALGAPAWPSYQVCTFLLYGMYCQVNALSCQGLSGFETWCI